MQRGVQRGEGKLDKPREPSRRLAIKGILAAAVTTAAATIGPQAVHARASVKRNPPVQAAQPKPVIVYRLRSRGTKASRACKRHNRYHVFQKRSDADKNRAHPGCNCPIVPQAISKKMYRNLFPEGSSGVVQIPRGYKLEMLISQEGLRRGGCLCGVHQE